jgi:hypothetical protein
LELVSAVSEHFLVNGKMLMPVTKNFGQLVIICKSTTELELPLLISTEIRLVVFGKPLQVSNLT